MNKKALKNLLMLGAFIYMHVSCFSIPSEKVIPKSSWSEVKARPALSCQDLKLRDKSTQISQVNLSLLRNKNTNSAQLSILFRDLKLDKSFLLKKIIHDLEEVNNENGSETIIEVPHDVEFISERNEKSTTYQNEQTILIHKDSSGNSNRLSFENFPRYSLMTLPSSVEAVLEYRLLKKSEEFLLLTREYVDFDDSKSSVLDENDSSFDNAVYKIVVRKMTFNPFKSETLFELEGDRIEIIENKHQNDVDGDKMIFLVDLGKNFIPTKRFKILRYTPSTKELFKEFVEIDIKDEITDWTMDSYDILNQENAGLFKLGEPFSDKSFLKTLKLISSFGKIPKLEPTDSLEIRHNSGEITLPMNTINFDAKISEQNAIILIQTWLDAESFVKIITSKGGNLQEYDRTGLIEEDWSLRQSVLETDRSKSNLWLLFNQIKSRKRLATRICVHELNEG